MSTTASFAVLTWLGHEKAPLAKPAGLRLHRVVVLLILS